MLVLSRHVSERIYINDNIIITIISVSGDKIRVGIDAPADVPVHREEVWRAIRDERREGGAA